MKPALVILVLFGINLHASMNETCVKAISPIAKRMKDIIYKSDGNDIVFTYTPKRGFFYGGEEVHFISLSSPYQATSHGFIVDSYLNHSKPFLIELNVENKGKFMISFSKNKKYTHIIREQNLIEQWLFINIWPFFYKGEASPTNPIFITPSITYSYFFYRLSQHDEINLSKNEKINIINCLDQFVSTSSKKHAIKIKELLKLK